MSISAASLDFKQKANSFADWLTALIISNFVYLIKFENKATVLSKLKDSSHLWEKSFWFSIIALVIIFFHKLFGVLAAQKRAEKKSRECEACLEWLRTHLFTFFSIVSAFALCCSGMMLYELFLR